MALSDNEGDTIDIKKGLNLALDDIQPSGSFMTSANIHTAINPGLYIPDVGNIGLPISAEHAKAIIQSCHLSPYGKGTETLVDESVRKSWQLDASQFALQNPRWQHQVELFMDKAVTGLGLTADWREVKAELYKLLIYQEGAFFLPHRDSEKADGMFGTLAVCLPSKHEGGDVIVSHRDDCLTFQTAPTSDFGMSWAAWYADVTHEVKPVTSGYRIVLIYNLIHRPSAALLEPHGASKENITRLLQSWACAAEIDSMQYLDGWDNDINSSCPQALIYVLEHQYTSAELRFSRLKGVDQCRFAGLRDACQRAGFDLFLANIEKKDIGEVDGYEDYYGDFYGRGRNGIHRIADLIETSLEMSHVVDSGGVIVGRNLSFPGLLLMQNGVFDRDPDKEDFQGFTGNEGASATHFYHETGALIIPRRFRFLFTIHQLKNGQGDALKVLEDCHCAVLEQPNDMQAKQKLLQVCRAISPVNNLFDLGARPQEGQDKVLQIALELSDVDVFCRAMEWLYSYLTTGIDAIYSSLQKLIQKEKSSGSQYKTSFSQKIELLYRLIEQYCGDDVSEVFTAHSGGTESDGHDLAREISDFPSNRALSRIVPFLETKLDNTAFLVAFLTSAHDYSLAGKFDKANADVELKALFSKIVASFKIESATSSHPNQSSYRRVYNYDLSNTTSRISPSLVVKLIQFADATGNDSTGVINTLTEHALDVKEETESAFHDFLFPVANGICAHIDMTNRSSTASERRFIKHMLARYVRDYVSEAPPSPPPDWKKRTTIRCICPNCASLRTFIDDTSSTTKDFSLGDKCRQHLDQQIDKAFFTTTTVRANPPKLRVEKTQALLVSDYKAWVTRAQTANSMLDELSQKGCLKEILGNQYDCIFSHQNLLLPDDLPAFPVPRGRMNTVQRTVPAKRPFGR
ncbi:hypothetical protein ANOM_004695 [Aspergillus nomiae NRRL 13137]|uniref:Fe2OG dioxygenase domain-containing protein n=1 Tax=Aspergillus nomiae NRRL (strain ATCC 15546 / NRRL 13137 / CBS 260.88 / M93) TaxID=1509407 RepID=A0A0L1J5K3_ASPN3|nr:uncharacterized protein ANOM_004695 [Aspergillus nomiae NRRL 13137]KNG87017.1 hypothetical protein ANOM_004695 [Aspergillus nomiae NRRL 13137]